MSLRNPLKGLKESVRRTRLVEDKGSPSGFTWFVCLRGTTWRPTQPGYTSGVSSLPPSPTSILMMSTESKLLPNTSDESLEHPWCHPWWSLVYTSTPRSRWSPVWKGPLLHTPVLKSPEEESARKWRRRDEEGSVKELWRGPKPLVRQPPSKQNVSGTLFRTFEFYSRDPKRWNPTPTGLPLDSDSQTITV